jgi:YaiO family outer membrane protein
MDRKVFVLGALSLTMAFISQVYAQSLPPSAIDATPSATHYSHKQPITNQQIAKLMQEKQYEKAIFYAKTILNENPNRYSTRILLGRVYGWQKHFARAKKEVGYVLQKDPKNLSARILLIDLALWQENDETALHLVKEALLIAPNNLKLQYREALIYFYQKKYASSRQVLLLIEKTHGESNKTKRLSARIQAAKLQGIKRSSRQIRDYPSSERIRYLAQHNQPRRAKRMARHLLKREPNNESMRLLLARLYGQEKQFKAADRQVDLVLRRNPTSKSAHKTKIDLSLWQQDNARAAMQAKTALKYHRNDPALLDKLATAYVRQGDYRQSAVVAKQLSAVSPRYPGIEKLNKAIIHERVSNPHYIFKAGQEIDTVSDQKDNWYFTEVELRKRTKYLNIAGQVTQANRFGESDRLYEIKAYPKLPKVGYLFLSYGFSDNGDVLPEHQYEYEMYLNLPHGFMGSIGQRYRRYTDNPVRIWTGSISKKLGSYNIRFKPYFIHDRDGDGQTYTLRVRKYFNNNRYHYYSITLGTGISPQVLSFQPDDVSAKKSKFIDASYQFPVCRPYILLKLGGKYEHEDFPANETREVAGIYAELRYLF